MFLHHSQTCKIKVSPLTKKCPTYFSCEVCHKVVRDLNIFRNHQESQHGLTLENFNEKIDKIFFEENPHDVRKQNNDVPYCRKCGKIVKNRYAMCTLKNSTKFCLKILFQCSITPEVS